MRKPILIVTAFLLCANLIYGQGFYNKNRNRNLIFSVGSGTTHYYGDLAKNGDHSNIRPNLAIGARYNFYRWFSAGAEFTWFMLAGDDKTDPGKEIRNLSFQSHNFEASLTAHVQMFPERRFHLRPFANPYAYVGVGIVNYNPTALLDGERYSLRPLETEQVKYSLVTAAFPVGVGVKFRINPYFNLALDGGYRFLTTDYLDDVSSGTYPDPASFEDDIARRLSDRSGEAGASPPFAIEGREVRGNPANNDGYFLFNIRLEYYFLDLGDFNRYGKRIKPYKINRRKLKPPRKTRRRRM